MKNHIQVPLKNLRFGHEAPVHPSNARITGRLDGIETLAANIHSRGLIEDLIVFDDGVPDILFVSDGNRSLAALRLIYSETSSELISCKLRSAEDAFEDSLAVAVLSHKLHPIDEYEGFARLRDDRGKTEEEIAQQYGLSEHEVAQVLALGGKLSAKTRDLWRHGKIKAGVAKALTMADPDIQDKILEEFAAQEAKNGGDLSAIEDYDIKQALKIGNDNSGTLVEFVGIDAYVARGGKVTRDLFGTDHKVSDPKLAKAMAAEKLKAECERLKQSGWSFAVTNDSVRNTRHNYSRLKIEPKPTPEEQQRLDELNAVFNPDHEVRTGYYSADSFAELSSVQQKAYREYQDLDRAIALRAYTPKMMEKAGCVVDVSEEGLLEVEFGYVKPADKSAAARVEKEEKRETAKVSAKAAEAAGKPAPESTVMSNALKERLESWLVAATRDAIAADPLLATSPFAEMLAKVVCAQIDTNRTWGTPDAVRTKLPSIRQTLDAGVFNAAIAKRFDAENYFSSAPKVLVVKAIAEAINPDEARKASTGKTKAEIWKFALANVGKTGWLPKELRTVHYKGPGSDGYKKPAAPPFVPGPPALARAAAPVRTPAKAAAKPPTKGKPAVKRAAATKKAAKKTSAKKTSSKKTSAKKKR